MLLNNSNYLAELRYFSKKVTNFNQLKGKKVLIAGATGMIGSCIVDLIMLNNMENNLECEIITLGRNEIKAKQRFGKYWGNPLFKFIKNDINKEICYNKNVDYLIHAASNTHPLAYAKDPIGTITTNVIGTYNLLNFASLCGVKRIAFLSSVEIYGENRGDIDKFSENYLGYINSNTLRAGYPESKRTGEALCQAFIKQKGLNVVIPRLARVFGPTMLMSDTKASSQFLKNGLAKENIVLKSKGNQNYSYIYSVDAAAAILFCLINGKNGESYNIANPLCDTTLKNLASIIAKICGTKVVFRLPSSIEVSGYSKATKALLNVKKFEKLGYSFDRTLEDSVKNTIKILSSEISN